jgi:hypothetical protein
MALVMRRSEVRIPEAAHCLALSEARSQLDHLPSGFAGGNRVALLLKRSPYANPYTVKEYPLAESLRLYRLHAAGFDVATLRRDLEGKDLDCWCPLDQPCHADLLLELANP